MNPADVQTILKPHLDAAERAQKEQKTKALADALMNAPDEIGRLNAMDSALVQGIITPQIWDSGFKRYGLTRPQPTATDLGGSILREMYNPVTGEYTNPTTLARTLTPQQVTDNAYKEELFNYTKQKDARDYKAGREDAAYARDLKNRELDLQEIKTMSDIEFKEWEQKNKEEAAQTSKWDKGDDAIIDSLNGEIKDIDSQISHHRDQIAGTTDDEKIKFHRGEISRLEEKKGAARAQIVNYVKSKTPKPKPKQNNSVSNRVLSYNDIIAKHAATYNVDEDLIRAIIQVESGGNPNAISKAGAQGLMQLMPATAKEYGVTNPFDPDQNIMAGGQHIAKLIKRYNGDIEKALAAYNGGPGNIDKGRMPAETRAYVPKVMTIYNNLKNSRSYFGTNTSVPIIPPVKNFIETPAQSQSPAQQNTNTNDPVLWTKPGEKSITQKQYQHTLQEVQAGKYPGLKNEEDLKNYFRKNGFTENEQPSTQTQGQPNTFTGSTDYLADNDSRLAEYYRQSLSPNGVSNSRVATRTVEQTPRPRQYETSDIEHIKFLKDIGLSDAELRATYPNYERILRGEVKQSANTPNEQQAVDYLNGIKTRKRSELGEDNSAIVWESADGQDVITQSDYDELIRRAEQGGLLGISSQEQLDQILESKGLRRTAQGEAPKYTDQNNGTTAWQLQEQLDILNGVADANPAWSYAYRRQYPSFDDIVARYV